MTLHGPSLAALHVGSLRLRTSRSDSPALRLALQRELGGADLAPSGLPPSAILVLRRMEDPHPGSLGSGGFRPPAVWERALRERLENTLRGAARPDRWGRVPANAPAVLFADPAELLACRLRALAARETDPWWTARLPEVLDGPTASARAPVALLARRIRELPAVLQRLQEWGAAGPVLGILSEREAKRLLVELVNEWSLPAALSGYRASSKTVTEKHRGKRTSSEDEPGASRRTGVLREPVEDPWDAWVPRAVGAASLHPNIYALAGVAFGLLLSPARLRSPALAERVTAWWGRVEASGVQDLEPRVAPAETRPASEAHDSPRTTLQITETTAFREDAPRPADSPSVDAPAFADGGVGGWDSRRETSPGTPSEPASSVPPHPELFESPARESPEQKRIDGSGTTLQEEAPEAIPDPDPHDFVARPGDTFLTAWGGVFYLIHLLEEQGLPGAAEDEWRLETLAGPWGVLDLVARGFLAHRFPEIADDPLWQMLEHLASWPEDREDDGAGEGPEELVYPLPGGCPAHLGVWLASALPPLRARLLLALGEDAVQEEAASETVDPVERLLAVPARIHLTSSHLDVVTGLDQIWLPARSAGLDRNPGWLPDYGRVVLIHFTEHSPFEELGGTPS